MPNRTALVCIALAAPAVFGAGPLAGAAAAHADAVAYLVNVTVRPGYNFPNADAALAYGQGICDHVAQGRSYADIVADPKSDFDASDEYQASYLISQAVNELCPPLIWQLRNSAAGYRAPRHERRTTREATDTRYPLWRGGAAAAGHAGCGGHAGRAQHLRGQHPAQHAHYRTFCPVVRRSSATGGALLWGSAFCGSNGCRTGGHGSNLLDTQSGYVTLGPRVRVEFTPLGR